MSLTITDLAVKKAKQLRSKMNYSDSWVLRVGLSGGGCSGFKYKLDFVEEPSSKEEYRLIEKNGLKLVCDKKSYVFLVGTEIDYEETLMNSGFIFNSPMASRKCGCGESVGF